jgi:preprotein translocase subunit SecE
MSEAVADKVPKKSWFKGLKSEFKKIIWADRKTITKQTIAVVSISVVLGLIITVIDAILQYGINFIVSL